MFEMFLENIFIDINKEAIIEILGDDVFNFFDKNIKIPQNFENSQFSNENLKKNYLIYIFKNIHNFMIFNNIENKTNDINLFNNIKNKKNVSDIFKLGIMKILYNIYITHWVPIYFCDNYNKNSNNNNNNGKNKKSIYSGYDDDDDDDDDEDNMYTKEYILDSSHNKIKNIYYNINQKNEEEKILMTFFGFILKIFHIYYNDNNNNNNNNNNINENNHDNKVFFFLDNDNYLLLNNNDIPYGSINNFRICEDLLEIYKIRQGERKKPFKNISYEDIIHNRPIWKSHKNKLWKIASSIILKGIKTRHQISFSEIGLNEDDWIFCNENNDEDNNNNDENEIKNNKNLSLFIRKPLFYDSNSQTFLFSKEYILILLEHTKIGNNYIKDLCMKLNSEKKPLTQSSSSSSIIETSLSNNITNNDDNNNNLPLKTNPFHLLKKNFDDKKKSIHIKNSKLDKIKNLFTDDIINYIDNIIKLMPIGVICFISNLYRVYSDISISSSGSVINMNEILVFIDDANQKIIHEFSKYENIYFNNVYKLNNNNNIFDEFNNLKNLSSSSSLNLSSSSFIINDNEKKNNNNNNEIYYYYYKPSKLIVYTIFNFLLNMESWLYFDNLIFNNYHQTKILLIDNGDINNEEIRVK